MIIPVGEWRPDIPDFQNPGSLEALNVIPVDEFSYGPFPSFGVYSTTALTARAQGAYYTRASDSSARNFAGDATKLYKLDASTPTQWDDVTRVSGGAYACATDSWWRFAEFGTKVLAVNGSDSPQKFDVDSDTNFSALSGSPPVGKYIATIRDFVFIAATASNRKLVQWSGINDSTAWSQSQTTMSDSQTLPDGGNITGLIGGEYGLVFQEKAIQRISFVGPPTIMQFDKISRQLGCTIDGSLAFDGTNAFFVNRRGFFMLVDGQPPAIPIGSRKVNSYFWNDVDTGNLPRISSAVDPTKRMYWISYPGAGNSGGTPNKMLGYQYEIGRWCHATPGDLEMIYQGASQAGLTLEGLDAISTSVDALPYSLDSSVYQGVAVENLAAFNTSHYLGYFNGSNLAYTVDTTEANLSGDSRYSMVRSARPMVDGGSPTLTIGYRNRLVDTVTYGSATAMDGRGRCRVPRVDARYHRGRIMGSAGDNFSHILGIDEIEFRATGTR